MVKRDSSLRLISSIIIVLVGVILLLSILYGTRLIFGSPAYCGGGSYDYKCVCGYGEVKTGYFPWDCTSLPDIPSEITFPIETWEEAIGYANNLMGGFMCTGNYQFDSPINGEIQQQCSRYGGVLTSSSNDYLGNIVSIECRSLDTVNEYGQPIAGQMVYDIRFDPNDGFVYKLHCEEGLINCPEVTFENNEKPNPQTICGDGCCHSGENNENCPSECNPIIEPICSAEDVANWIVNNGGNLAYNQLCILVGGNSKITGVSIYPNCNYEQRICEVNGKEVLRWHVNSLGNCGTHSLLGYNDELICQVI